MAKSKKHRDTLGWLPKDHLAIEQWIQKLRKHAQDHPRPLIRPILEFKQMVYSDPVLYANVQGMFAEAHRLKKRTPLKWEPEPINFEDFLELLNAIMFTAPEAYQTSQDGYQYENCRGEVLNKINEYLTNDERYLSTL